MNRFCRLRKTARSLSKQFGHELGYFIFTSPDMKHEAKCIYCGLPVFISERSDIKINYNKRFNNPQDLTPIIATKIAAILKQELLVEIYGPKQSGYIYGQALIIFCDENPTVSKIPISQMP